jgi:molecular chaperone GrpE
MSEEKKEAYEVGIPIDELPSPEAHDGADNDSSLPDIEPEATPDASELPDLFDPEELAEAGLTAELAEPLDDGNEGDTAPDEDAGPEAHGAVGLPAIEDLEDSAAESTLFTESEDADAAPSIYALENPLPEAETAPDLDPPPTEKAIASALASAGPTTDADDQMRPDPDAVPTDHAAEDDLVEDEGDGPSIDEDLFIGRLESISLQISELQREFEGKLKYDAHKDEIIDRLHTELQEYKQDILKKYILSIVMDVVKVADDIRKWLTYFRSLDVSQRDPRKLFRYLEAIPSDLEDVFYWHGVKPFASEDGPFDPGRQRAIKKIPTADANMDKIVAHSIRPGYEWETKVIRQEMVAVYVYQEEQQSMNTGMIDE